MPAGYKFRDVGEALQRFRDFLLGRKSNLLHQRFEPCLAPRSIPRPDIPRSPFTRYSDQYYNQRDAMNSVKPPLVAPIALGKICGAQKEGTITTIEFPTVPTPALVWWWDGHCYFECVPDVKASPSKKEPPPPPPPHPPAHREEIPPKPAPGPCDPCQPSSS